ncbi:transposase [Gluconobacter sp. NFX36]
MDLAIPVGELKNLLAFRVRKTWTSEESLALLVDARQSGMSLDRYVKMNGLTSSMLYRWRSLKYECVSLHTFETGFELRAGLAGWIAHYNGQRPHSALAGRTPDEAYHDGATPSGLGLAPDQMANSNSVRMAA